jgi:hypothetical protein
LEFIPRAVKKESARKTLPIVIGLRMDPVGGGNAGNTILGALFENPEFLFLAKALVGLVIVEESTANHYSHGDNTETKENGT